MVEALPSTPVEITGLSEVPSSGDTFMAFETEKEAHNFFKYATSEIIRFAFLMTDESLTSLAKKVPDLLNYTDSNGLINYNEDVNMQLYRLFGIADTQRQYIKKVLSTKK